MNNNDYNNATAKFLEEWIEEITTKYDIIDSYEFELEIKAIANSFITRIEENRNESIIERHLDSLE